MKPVFGSKLDASNSRVYRAKSRPKHARIHWRAAEYRLDWGTQVFRGPHVLVLDTNGHYGVDIDVFFGTHRPVVELDDHYVKIAKVRAICVTEACVVITKIKGQTEMIADLPVGAYILENPAGERYGLSVDEFILRYELDDDG